MQQDKELRSGNSGTNKVRARWKLLADAVRKGKVTQQTPSTTKRHAGFGLFDTTLDHSDEDNEYDFIVHRPKDWILEGESSTSLVGEVILRQRKPERKITTEELFGFDNTGNVCVWPSEEILAFYCIKHRDLFVNKVICELGAGLGLAGFCIARFIPCSHVLITDGNDNAVTNILYNIEANKDTLCTLTSGGRVEGCKLLWDRNTVFVEQEQNKFDLIVASDCLFLEEYHLDFLHVAANLLKPDGKVLLFAPQRGGSLERFLEKVKQQEQTWKFEVEERYDERIEAKHNQFVEEKRKDKNNNNNNEEENEKEKRNETNYEPDLHYPFFLTLHKCSVL